ncbi:hypothetical protein EDB80DRAFT_782277 [Ilyonectria destructans]|nr:hypothetical protein EDB80DRAFT_782277 [Ilyonectria destructans]
MPDLVPTRRHRRRYESSPDLSDDEYYYSDDERRPRSRSLGHGIVERLDDILPGRSRSRRRARSLDEDDELSRDRGHHRNYDRKRHAERKSHSSGRLKHAAVAAIDAAAVEAIRVWRKPGNWNGSKGTRVATAALGAAAIDAMVGGNSSRHGKRKLAESVVGGLLANRVMNGPRDELRYR